MLAFDKSQRFSATPQPEFPKTAVETPGETAGETRGAGGRSARGNCCGDCQEERRVSAPQEALSTAILGIEHPSPNVNSPLRFEYRTKMGNVSETPTPTTCRKSTAVHLQFVRQYPPHLYRRAFLASKLRRKGNPAIHLQFVLQYASHLHGNSTEYAPDLYGTVLLEKCDVIISCLFWADFSRNKIVT